jgi:hypothetical protein
MRLDLLPHEARPVVFWEPSRCSGCCSVEMMMMVNCGEIEGLCGLCYASGSRHSMSATCGPRDIISLVTPRDSSLI